MSDNSYRVPAAIAENVNVTPALYKAMYQQSIEQPEMFWQTTS